MHGLRTYHCLEGSGTVSQFYEKIRNVHGEDPTTSESDGSYTVVSSVGP